MKELNSFTVERLEEILQTATFSGSEEIKALARIALAAKRAEPIGYLEQYHLEYLRNGFTNVDIWPDDSIGDIPVYLTPQLNSPEIPEGWIKCSDRVPENTDIQFFVYCKDGIRRNGYFDGNDWGVNGKYYDESFITHWMSLPAAPEKSL
ncbi:DUF551 domain-containing protein [Yersinia ruckeri]|uniref:DUF551 domain-containing protein n=1 Tax=Yersinia ruckeri TaxID=29486 RepID=UPI0022376771|nr:DUF551 domain-containing protein [Yersinia ruckeri]MCW6550356.1 DUF551 domain-containing protein [Yersinia ruckeri]